jgi:malonyl-CoA/methylmalonyl-CoA synthetase
MTPPAWARHLPTGLDWSSVDLLARRTLPQAWVDNWSRDPRREVLRDVDGTWLSGADLLERTEGAARRLRGSGLQPGDRVVLSGGISASYVVAYCAALRAGLVVVPVNPAFTRAEVSTLLGAAQPAAAIVESDQMRGWMGDCIATDIGIDLPQGPAFAIDDVATNDPALLPFTSGTTGAPKGALLSHGNLLASAEALLVAWRWTRDDRLILALPLYHMHGLGNGVHGTLLAGASAILLPSFDAEAVLRTASEATMFFGVPTMYTRIVAANEPERLAALRLCVSGSAPMSADLHREVTDKCRQVALERYGMTETVMLVSNPYDGERRPGTVGFPLPGVEVRLDPELSEIEVRGPNVFGGYADRPDANAEAFTSDGWFRTGDVGSFDADGYLSIVGRTKELIITGGYNVYPREIEDLLVAHPSVIDAAVGGTPSEEWGEIVTAYVVATDDLDDEQLLAWAAGRLAPYKRPRIVHHVDAIPRNHLGKVVRDKLPS